MNSAVSRLSSIFQQLDSELTISESLKFEKKNYLRNDIYKKKSSHINKYQRHRDMTLNIKLIKKIKIEKSSSQLQEHEKFRSL